MYSLKNIDDRFVTNCIVKYSKPRVRRFVVDTGARYTCCIYDYINPALKEDDFSNCRTKLLGGFVANVGMKFYECKLDQFTIGTVDLKDQNIWITFDPRIADSLLGMDILKQVLFLNRPDKEEVDIYTDYDELKGDLPGEPS